MKKLIIITESLLLFLLIGIISTQSVGLAWSTEEIFKSCQPEEINYESYDPYCVSIIKQNQTLTSNYIILIAQESEPNYGYVLTHPAPYITSLKDLQNTEVSWTNEGILIKTYMDTEIFIPKNNFTGGR